MIKKKHIGHEFSPVVLPVEEGRLKFLAQTLGMTKGIYTDPNAAAAAGTPSSAAIGLCFLLCPSIPGLAPQQLHIIIPPKYFIYLYKLTKKYWKSLMHIYYKYYNYLLYLLS